IYEVIVATSDGTSSAVQEVIISVSDTTVKIDNSAIVETTVSTPPLTPAATAAEESEEEEDDPLADALAPAPGNESVVIVNEQPNSLQQLAPPASIVVDDSVADSIAPNNPDNPTGALPGSASSLVRELLMSGAQGPANFAFQLAAETFDDGLSSASFVDGLDNMRRELDKAGEESAEQSEIFASVAAGASATVTVGIIGWILRAGSMIATFLTSAPLWRHLDPLSIVGGGKSRREEDGLQESNTEDRKLDHLFRRGSGGKK
ncbi:MAG: hypothetical protein HKN70_09155, partial [Gammaproteobacteria bacterium]|nr:hypothetical protein [Gammaproteobacteria bacterium]